MKLPKPGKIRNRFLQRNLFSLIVIAVLVIGTGTAYGTLSARDANHGNDPVNGVNQNRYQVLVSGEGFKLSKEQEKDYKLQKKQNEANAANAAQNPRTIRNPYSPRTFRSGSSYHFRNSYHSSFKASKNPRVTSDIASEISKLDNPVKGDTFKIRVSAYAYPYGKKNAIASDNVAVNVEGGSATLYKSETGNHYYKIELGEGKNKITITVTDKKNKKTAKLGPYFVTAGAGNGGSNTDPSHGSDDPGNQETKAVAVTVNYGTDGTISLNGNIDETKTLAEALQEMGVTINDSDIEYVPGEFSLDKLDTQLRSKYRKDKNLSDDEDINPTQYNSWLESEVISKTKDGIGKDHPFSTTHWTCDTELSSKVKDLPSEITLTLVLYED